MTDSLATYTKQAVETVSRSRRCTNSWLAAMSAIPRQSVTTRSDDARVWQWLIDIDKTRSAAGRSGQGLPQTSASAICSSSSARFKNNLNRAAGQPEELVVTHFTANKLPPPEADAVPGRFVFGKQAPPAPRPRHAAAPPRPTLSGEEGIAAPAAPRGGNARTAPRAALSEILYAIKMAKLRTSTSPYAETLIDNYKLRYESTEANEHHHRGRAAADSLRHL